MADNHVVIKQCMKELADAKGTSVTFMAKPEGHQAGSSCHLHLSLHAADGSNAFLGDRALGSVEGCSDAFVHFLGGLIKHAPDVLPLYAPTARSLILRRRAPFFSRLRRPAFHSSHTRIWPGSSFPRELLLRRFSYWR